MSNHASISDRVHLYFPMKSIKSFIRRQIDLRLLGLVVALGVFLPMGIILVSVLQPEVEIWQHMVETLMVDMIRNTIFLSIGVLAGTFVLGVGSAWLTAVCDFPGRSFFNWALMMPLAIPTYVFAFVFIGLLDFSGPVQTFLRGHAGHPLAWFPPIRSTGGVILVFSLALYPYVYLLARNAFKTQGKRILEISQALGYTPRKSFFKSALPMARPWIAGGLMLVLMETLADFGAVSIFNYDTFTTGIYKAWFGFFSIRAAAQLSAILLSFVFLLIVAEQRMRNQMRFHQVGSPSLENQRIRLAGMSKWLACIFLAAIVVVAFVIPCSQLIVWAMASAAEELDSRYFGLLIRSIFFAGMAVGIITTLGLLMAYIRHLFHDRFSKWIIQLATMGYAFPGTVLAVGIAILVNKVDLILITTISHVAGFQFTSYLSGTIWVVLFAYTVRFLTVGFNTINSSMLRITRNMDEASALLGITGIKLIKRVHIPILKNGLLTAAMLVFVDVMKEMPITLMTRPFGWDTLAVKIFELTSEGEWQRAALPAVSLVLAGLIPLMLLNKRAELSKM